MTLRSQEVEIHRYPTPGGGCWICLRHVLTGVSVEENPGCATGPVAAREDALMKQLADRVACLGKPTRPIVFDLAWRTTTVTSLARSIDDGQAFDRMPILADALEEAGCDNGDVLRHCRSTGEHTRGCWVVELVLDRG